MVQYTRISCSLLNPYRMTKVSPQTGSLIIDTASVDLEERLSPVTWAMFSVDLACLCSILTPELQEGRWDRLLLRSRDEALHFPLPLTDLSELLELVR